MRITTTIRVTVLCIALLTTNAYLSFSLKKVSKNNKQKIKNTRKFFPNSSFSIQFRDIDMKQFELYNNGFTYIMKTTHAQ